MGGRPVICVMLLATACSRAGSLELRDWTLTPLGGAPSALRLPAHFGGAAPRPPAFTLQRAVELPPQWRGERLTLGFDKLASPGVLTVNGVEAQSLGGDRGSYRVGGAQLFRIAPAQSAAGTLQLELTLANTWTQSSWIEVVPRLSATDEGDQAFRSLRTWNFVSSVLGLCAAFVASLIFLSIFWLDRKREDAGWFAVEAMCGAFYPALNLNLLSPIVGDFDVPITAIAVAGAGVAGVYMMHAFVGRGRPHPIWRIALFAQACSSVIGRGPFHATFFGASTAGAFLAVAAGWQVWAYWRASQRNVRGALTLSLGWLARVLLGGVDILGWMGFGSVFGGWQGAGIGIFMIALTESFNLSREHVHLNRELQRRVAALEASYREVGQLNEELQYQIKARSKELSDAFSQQAAVLTEASQLSEGDTLSGRYRIEAQIGSGGMGVVYRATRLSDDKPCAIKVIKHARSPQLLARMSREALALADISHPNVVRILDIDVSGSWLPFIVMELVEGVPLADRPDRFGRLDFGLPVLSQTADALQAVHGRNFVHRDLKPGNIILLDEPHPTPLIKVVDFGLAGLLQTDRSSLMKLATTGEIEIHTGPTAGRSITQSGVVFGTPMYMAPEYVAGTKEIGPPADIFSFGIIAYEVLTKQRPFSELPITAAVRGHPLEPFAPLEQACRGLPPELARLLRRCLSASPAERPTATELANALRPN